MTDLLPEAIADGTAAAKDVLAARGPWFTNDLSDLSQRIAGAVLEAAAPHIAAAERERLYDQLGNDHYVIFTEDRWMVEHSIECRLSGHMPECVYHAAVARIAGGGYLGMAGRWLITGIDSEGLPDLLRRGLGGGDT